MDKLLSLAEEEMMDLKQPYVGSHHLLLAYLKDNKNEVINYEDFKNYIIKYIGCCKNKSERVLYTPYMRNISRSNMSLNDAIRYVLKDDNSIAHNILVAKKIDIENLLNNI